MTDTTADRRDDALDAVRTAAARLAALTASVDKARADLYAAVHGATLTGAPTMTVADAAGWRTKKAVYDACRIVDGADR
jgi:hypothetical protein